MRIQLKGTMTIEMMAEKLLKELRDVKVYEVYSVNLYVGAIGKKEHKPGAPMEWEPRLQPGCATDIIDDGTCPWG